MKKGLRQQLFKLFLASFVRTIALIKKGLSGKTMLNIIAIADDDALVGHLEPDADIICTFNIVFQKYYISNSLDSNYPQRLINLTQGHCVNLYL